MTYISGLAVYIYIIRWKYILWILWMIYGIHSINVMIVTPIPCCGASHFNILLFPLLTLNVRRPSYLGLTRSISWLLMPWLLMSPGHQQPWYWLCRICRSWSSLRKDLSTCVLSMWSNDIKCKYMSMFPLKKLALKWLSYTNSAELYLGNERELDALQQKNNG